MRNVKNIPMTLDCSFASKMKTTSHREKCEGLPFYSLKYSSFIGRDLRKPIKMQLYD